MKEKYKKIRAKFASDLPPAEDERFPHPVSVSASKTKQTLVNHKEAFDTGIVDKVWEIKCCNLF